MDGESIEGEWIESRIMYVSLCMYPCEVRVSEEGGGRRREEEGGEKKDGGSAEKTKNPLRKWGIIIINLKLILLLMERKKDKNRLEALEGNKASRHLPLHLVCLSLLQEAGRCVGRFRSRERSRCCLNIIDIWWLSFKL